jgi:NAD(P)-dependent dehydrogenase (short-subunit alcohol dehydrogenase family)
MKGKSVLITGAGGGLGRALVAAFAQEGARVTAADVADAPLDDLPIAARLAFDLRDAAQTLQSAQAIVDSGTLPDILINNAGWTRVELMAEMEPEKSADEIGLNLTSVINFTTPLVKAMAKRGSGSIVFISSVNALAHYGNPAYAAAKAGINAYARAIAVEYGRHGVRANVVCPGSIRTPAWDHRIARDASIPQKLARVYPLERIVEASEVANAAVFLASDLASGITGVVLPVDAGLSAGNKPFIDSILGGA